jgi:ribosomal protein L37AE/L43A
MNGNKNIHDKPKVCPSCKHDTTFRYAGELEYPLAIAQAAGFNTNHFTLWMCNHCHTSQIEPTEQLVMVAE